MRRRGNQKQSHLKSDHNNKLHGLAKIEDTNVLNTLTSATDNPAEAETHRETRYNVTRLTLAP